MHSVDRSLIPRQFIVSGATKINTIFSRPQPMKRIILSPTIQQAHGCMRELHIMLMDMSTRTVRQFIVFGATKIKDTFSRRPQKKNTILSPTIQQVLGFMKELRGTYRLTKRLFFY
jgi:hypothetical protein